MRFFNKTLFFLFYFFVSASLGAQTSPQSPNTSNTQREMATTAGALRSSTNSSSGANAGGATVQTDEFTGAVTYAVAIPVPPGRGAVTPSLALNYHSQRKNPNSWVGNGWDLDVGTISSTQGDDGSLCDVPTRESDFEVRLAGQTETLKFIGDRSGNYLHRVGADRQYQAATAEVFQAKIEAAFNEYYLVHGGSDTNRLDYWVVKDKNGIVYIFDQRDYDIGAEDITPPDMGIGTGVIRENRSCISRWHLSTVIDPNNNVMQVHYDPVSGLMRDLEYQDVRVEFVTGFMGAEDSQKHYYPAFRESGVSREQFAKVLNEVRIFANGFPLQRIRLTYEVTPLRRIRQLAAVQQWGATNAESLPPMHFEYYPESDLSFESRPQQYVSHNHVTDDPKFLYLNAAGSPQLAFADMNGDGFVDQIAAFSDHMDVYYNNGSDFVRTSETRWSQPFSCDTQFFDVTGRLIFNENNFCRDKVTDSFVGGGQSRQRLFLMDMNGDALPDRVARIIVRNYDTNDETANFRIAFNTGHGWGRVEEWEDPHHGHFAGLSDSHQGFADMNGDGLIDRIVGGNDQDYFLVYFNNGAGFNSLPVRWEDPLASFHADDRGKIYAATRSGNVYISIRDFNGDGLPDRIWKTVFYQTGSNTVVGEGFSVSLNTGSYWAMPRIVEGDRTHPDGFKNIAILDPADDAGVTNDSSDLIDMNGDGYLDRVVADEDTGKIRVWFYRGFQVGFNVTRFSTPIEIDDPAKNSGTTSIHYTSTDPVYPDATRESTSYRGSLSYTSGDNYYRHTFLMDLNGDGFPDRLAIQQNTRLEMDFPDSRRIRVLDYGGPNYTFYPLRVNAVSTNGTEGVRNFVNQSPGLIKSVINDQGGRFVLEYQPTTYGWESSDVSDHRYLPFPIQVIKSLYTEEPSLAHPRPIVYLDAPRHWTLRYPGMRRTEYRFRGGSYFIRYAQKRDPSNPSSNELIRKRVARFNGFHEVEKTLEAAPGETWTPLKQTTFYAQALTEVFVGRYWRNPLLPAADTYYHYALSGKPYLVIAQEGDRVISREEFAYQLNTTTPEMYECSEDTLTHSSSCYPRLEYHTKYFWEATGPVRSNTAHYDYDAFGNITKESHFGPRTLLSEVETQYYPESRFTRDSDTLSIKNRPSVEIKKGPSAVVYRKKTFDYDRAGNSTEERYFLDEGGAQTHVLSRRYDASGLLSGTTDIDGVVKEFRYDSVGLFPEQEIIIGPGDQRITTYRNYSRQSGEAISETSQLGVSKGTTVDSFGRPLTEWVRGTDDVTHTIKRMQYDFIDATINGWPNITVQKIQAWEFKPDYPSETRPASISYQSPGLSQQCSLSERGNYRVVHSWTTNAGREEFKTEPRFSSDCELSTSLPTGVTVYRTQKDSYDRITYVEGPAGDPGSPLGTMHVSYVTNGDGHLVKTMVNARSQSIIEEYDEKDRLLKKTDPLRTTLEYRFNGVDELTDVYQGSQLITHIEYDLLGRKRMMQDSDMGTWRYFYDSRGRLDYQEDAAHQKVRNSYDGIGRLDRKTFYRADGSVEKYHKWFFDRGEDGYDVRLGEIYKVEEFKGDDTLIRRTRYNYDNTFRRASRVSRYIPTVGEFHQDSHYDILGRVLDTQYPGGEKLYQTFMRQGGLMQVCSGVCGAARSETYYRLDPTGSFSDRGSILKEFYGNGVESDYSYYPNSKRLQNKKIVNGDKTYFDRNYTYDEMANVKTLSDNLNSQGNAALNNVTYDSLDRLAGFQYAGSTRAERVDYDLKGNILKNTASYGDALYQYASPRLHAVTQIGEEHFDYDANGNMVSDNYRRMDYDANNQLVRVTMRNGDIVTYDYDFSGARVFKRVEKHLLDHSVQRNTVHYLGDVMEIRDDQLVLNVFAEGRRVATKTAGRISTSTGASGGTLINNGIDPEVNGTVIIPYILLVMTILLLASMRPLPILNRSRRRDLGRLRPIYHFWKSWTDTVLETLSEYPHRRWVKTFLLFMIVLMQVQWSIVAMADDGRAPAVATDVDYLYYNHDDHLGSAALLTEGKVNGRHAGLVYHQGDLLQRFEYAPFGRETFSLNPNLNFDPSYTGQHYDLETGLYFYKARYYNPILGRFTQPDTVIPDAKNLQDYNRYTYVNNNPLKYVDPSGHFAIGAFIFALALGAMLGGMTAAMSGTNPLIGALQGILSAAIFFGAGEIIQTVQVTTQAARHLMARALIHAIAGAVSGALNTAISGGSLSQIGRSALVGGLSAGVAKAVGEPIEMLNKLAKSDVFVRTLTRSALGAATGAMTSALAGGNPLEGARLGAFTAAAASLFNEGFEEQHRRDASRMRMFTGGRLSGSAGGGYSISFGRYTSFNTSSGTLMGSILDSNGFFVSFGPAVGVDSSASVFAGFQTVPFTENTMSLNQSVPLLGGSSTILNNKWVGGSISTGVGFPATGAIDFGSHGYEMSWRDIVNHIFK